MMNYIWAFMLILGIGFAAWKGDLDSPTDGLMESSANGIYFPIGLAGIMATWAGLMNIAKESGLLNSFAKLMRPFMRFLFPKEKNKGLIVKSN